MKKIPKSVAGKMEKVANAVISDLKRKGYVVPVKNPDGSIQYDKYLVTKTHDGFYQVTNKTGKVYADNLNLPQTAAVLAHSMALGNLPDEKLVTLDKNYGYRAFDEDLYRAACHRSNNDVDLKILYQTRYEIAKQRKNQFKSQIMKSFRKLIAIA